MSTTMPAVRWGELVSSTISTLEAMENVFNVTQEEKAASTAEAIDTWEKRFTSLPPDFKSFLKSSDGLKVTWHVRHGNDLLPIGCMHINSLADMEPVPPEALLNERGELCAELPPPLPGGIQAFDLDVRCNHGRVCLISTGGRGESSRAQELLPASQRGPPHSR